MKPEQLSDFATKLCESSQPDGCHESTIAAYERREEKRQIMSLAVQRERFLQKVRSPTFEWKKPAPRR